MYPPKDDYLVPCPSCMGTGESPYREEACRCCYGTGVITEKLRRAKAIVAKDIAARLANGIYELD
jgi:DnaJ-class molecular chaperone